MFGLAAATVLPDPIYRAMPESWHWPERRAANVLDRDMWEAGERLQAVADPKRLETRSAIEAATNSAGSGIGQCLKAVASARKATKCDIVAKPVSAERGR